MGADFAADGKEWPKLWAFCCGLAGEESLEELEAAADGIAERGLTPVPGIPVPWTSRPRARTSSWHATPMARASC
jgi:hypothetical protein